MVSVDAAQSRTGAATALSDDDGVALLLARKFGPAQERFEAALALDERLAEAHNNLAFALRDRKSVV